MIINKLNNQTDSLEINLKNRMKLYQVKLLLDGFQKAHLVGHKFSNPPRNNEEKNHVLSI